MQKNTFIFSIIFLINCASFAQEIIASSGASLKGENIQLEYTLGEIAVSRIENESQIVDQGFHSGLVIEELENNSVSIDEKFSEISVWPNPASDVFNIQTKDFNISYMLLDMNRDVLNIQGMVPSNSSETVNITNLYPAIYFLRLTDEENNFKVLKIIKSN